MLTPFPGIEEGGRTWRSQCAPVSGPAWSCRPPSSPLPSRPSNGTELIPIARGSAEGPLPYSCLGNRMDRGAWRAIVQGVTQSRTWLSDMLEAPGSGRQLRLSSGFPRAQRESPQHTCLLPAPNPAALPRVGRVRSAGQDSCTGTRSATLSLESGLRVLGCGRGGLGPRRLSVSR